MSPEEQQEDRIIRRGQCAGYHWLTATGDIYIGTLLLICPEAVVPRYLAVTSSDSGFFRPTAEDAAVGWHSECNIAYSPLVTSVDSLKFQRDGLDSPGFDEWYVFPEQRTIGPAFEGDYFQFDPKSGETLVFVNLRAFVLHDPAPDLPHIMERFWKQLTSISPETFIADGEYCLTVVSRSEALIDDISQRVAALS